MTGRKYRLMFTNMITGGCEADYPLLLPNLIYFLNIL